MFAARLVLSISLLAVQRSVLSGVSAVPDSIAEDIDSTRETNGVKINVGMTKDAGETKVCDYEEQLSITSLEKMKFWVTDKSSVEDNDIIEQTKKVVKIKVGMRKGTQRTKGPFDFTLFKVRTNRATIINLVCRDSAKSILFKKKINLLDVNKWQNTIIEDDVKGCYDIVVKFTKAPNATKFGIKSMTMTSCRVTCPEITNADLPGNLQMSVAHSDVQWGTDTCVSFTCPDGYRLVGDASSCCVLEEPNGVWSHPIPYCERITCSTITDADLTPDVTMTVTDPDTPAQWGTGTCVSFSVNCPLCHEMVGDLSFCCVQVGNNGQWDGMIPYCAQRTIDFLPYGPSNGDHTMRKVDDGYDRINITIQFPYFGNSYNHLYVNTNGGISFLKGVRSYTPKIFPTSDLIPFIAVYWADVDNDRGGSIYYREVTDVKTLALIDYEITSRIGSIGPGFNGVTWAYIVTWDQVAAYYDYDYYYHHDCYYYDDYYYDDYYYDSCYDYDYYYSYYDYEYMRNDFQLVIATDETHSFAITNYGQLDWVKGAESNVPAQVGYDAADNVTFYMHPLSRTYDIDEIEDCIIYKVDGLNELGSSP